MMHRQVKDEAKKLEQKAVANKEQVKEALQQNLDLAQTQEKEVAELRRQLTDVQMQVAQLQAQREACTDNNAHEQQIQNLQSELAAMEKDFQDMTELFKHSMDAALNKIEDKTSQLIDEEKQLAIERVINLIDKPTHQALTENEWLKRKLSLYREEVSALDAAISSLEEENLEHLRKLFENHLNDLQISRNVFLTQPAGLVQQPVQNLSITDTADFGVESTAEAGRAPQQKQQSGVLEQDETDASCRPSSFSSHDLSMLLYTSPSEIRASWEPLQTGPLAQKLMIVVGQAMTLYPLPTDSKDLGMPLHRGFFQTQNQPTATDINRFH
ncbi:coiled-coil domain-containing protein 83 isoform X2 [Trichomycterus rosablanca]